jgi:hypothetical protein
MEWTERGEEDAGSLMFDDAERAHIARKGDKKGDAYLLEL